MGMVRLIAVSLLLFAATAMGESLVQFTLELGGDNHADAIKAGTPTLFTPGSSADSQTFTQGTIITWGARLTASGTQVMSDTSHPAHNKAIQGVANFVFNLEMHNGTADGTLAAGADFFSSLHDGTGALTCTDCAGPSDVCAGAAFAYSYNIASFGPGTVHSPLESPGGGPRLDVCMYPTTSEPGKLLGQGSGYSQWNRTSNYAIRTTKGVGIAKASGGLGDGGETDKTVVVEGQIDTAGMAPGTYVLKLVPGTGINVLRGDVNLVTDPSPSDQVQAFAVAANTTQGDTITFTVIEVPVGSPAVIASAVSRKAHGSNSFDVNINTSAAIEPRIGGPTQLVVTFDKAIALLNTAADVTVSSGTISGLVVNGSTLTVNMSGATERAPLTIAFPGVSDATAPTTANACTGTLCVGVLMGDAGRSGSSVPDGTVNIYDLICIKNSFDQAATASNFLDDISSQTNTAPDGAINIYDIIAVKNNFDRVISANCP